MKTQNVELSILVNGNAVPEYRKDSSTFIEGRSGTEYVIKIKNHNNYKCKICLGIDGIGVIDSKPLGDDPNQMGYILDANQETIIKGYRVDSESVASFKFVNGDKAYANKSKGMKGKTQGVISAKVYAEKVLPIDFEKELAKIKKQIDEKKQEYVPVPYPVYPSWPRNPWYDDSGWPKQPVTPWVTWCGGINAVGTNSVGNDVKWVNLSSDNCAAGNNSVNYCHTVFNDAGNNPNSLLQSVTQCSTTLVEQNPFELGSAFGKKVEQKIKEVEFQVGNLIAEIALYYTSKSGLEALGVEMKKLPAISKMPQAFPASKTKYCELPSGWDGV